MYRLTRYRTEAMTRATLERLQPLREALQAEKNPDDPPPTVENLERQLAGIPPHIELETWLATLPDGTVAGVAVLVLFTTDGQKYLADGRVEILPSLRRKGLGRRLFSVVRARARERGRTNLVVTSFGKVPASFGTISRCQLGWRWTSISSISAFPPGCISTP